MRKTLLSLALTATIGMVFAGNPDRAGEAGAYELNMNTWARSSGLFGMNSAVVNGIESSRVNPAGLADFKFRTEIVGSYSLWFEGTDVTIAQAGLSQALGENVIGLSIQSLNFGDIVVTTSDAPEGGLGTYSPNFLNIGLSYARAFSNSIYGGATFRLINESIPDLNATGFALDAGLQYTTGSKEHLHFGVAIRNVGTALKFGGDGFSFRGAEPTNGDYNLTLSQRSAKFEMPSLLNIGIGYDIYAGRMRKLECKDYDVNDHRITLMGQFTSNSFGRDHIGGGVEYAFRELIMARVAYRYEDGVTKSLANGSSTAYSGLAAGLSFEMPLGQSGTNLGIDYSYRPTKVFNGTHSIGIHLGIGNTCKVDKSGATKPEKTKKAKKEKEPKAEKVKEEKTDLEAEKADKEAAERAKKTEELLAKQAAEEAKAAEAAAKEAAERAKKTAELLAKQAAEEAKAAEKDTKKNTKKDEEVKKLEEVKAIIESVESSIQFETGSAVLTDDALSSLNKVVEFMKTNDGSKIEISAHTDNNGSEDANLELSKKRAQSVKNYFVYMGIQDANVTAQHFGESKPIADNGTPEGQKKNRRVELEVSF